MISTGVSVPYSDEYRELRSNPASLETIATVTNGATNFLKIRANGTPDLDRSLKGVDHFRRDPSLVNPKAYADLWPNLLWLACILFLADVAVRRIAPDVDRMRKVVADQWLKLRGREVVPSTEYMEKLRNRKAEVGDQIDRSRAATRFEAPPPAEGSRPLGEPLLDRRSESNEPTRQRAPTSLTPGLGAEGPKPESEGYTNRLLKAKKKVWEERDKKKDNGNPS